MTQATYARSVEQWARKAHVQQEYLRILEHAVFFSRPDLHVLDFGCNTGLLAAQIKQRHPWFLVDGFDPNVDAISIAKRQHPLLKDHFSHIFCYPVEHYDIVVLSHVLNHLPFPEGKLSQIRETMVKGGHLIVTTPNFWYYALNPMAWLRGDKTVKHHHVRPEKLLEDNGFKIEHSVKLGRRNWWGQQYTKFIVAKRAW